MAGKGVTVVQCNCGGGGGHDHHHHHHHGGHHHHHGGGHHHHHDDLPYEVDDCHPPPSRSDNKAFRKIAIETAAPLLQPLSRIPKEVQAHSCLEPQKDPCAPAHNDFICHSLGEKRQHYLREVKKVLDKMDTSDCPTQESIQNTYGTSGKGKYDRPMIKFPGYLDADSPKFKKPFFEPLITNIAVQEIRPSSDVCKAKADESPYLKFIPISEREKCKPWALPRKKSFELRGGIMFKGCDCDKHNGLQDQCERTDCHGAPECKTQPEPTCAASLGFVKPPPQRPREDLIREVAGMQHGGGNRTFCCCPVDSGFGSRNIQGKQAPDCNHASGHGKFECYKCRQ